MKNDQTGDRKRDTWYIYSNSHDAFVFPMTALSIYLSVFNIACT